jgi:hypothetical protein
MSQPPTTFISLLMVTCLAGRGESQQRAPVAVAQPAPAVLRSLTPTPVATAALPGLLELSLPQGSKIFIRKEASLFSASGAPLQAVPGSLFQREIRGGRSVLVETKYETTYEKNRLTGMNGTVLKPTTERLYPGDSKLVYTGPWVVGGAGWRTYLYGYRVYLLRPLDTPVATAMPRTGTTSLAELNAGAVALPKSNTTARTATNPGALIPSNGCALDFVAKTVQQGAEIPGLACLLLQEGQGITLDGGMRLFHRDGVTEVWKSDELVETTGGLILRDSRGRHWLLQGKGYQG